MIDISKLYRTRDNHKVRLYATDGARGTIHGAILNDDFEWDIMFWRSDGRRMQREPHNHDLIEVKPRQKVSVWTNIYKTPNSEIVHGQLFHTKEVAEQYAVRHDRIACIKIDLDFEEGEGL